MDSQWSRRATIQSEEPNEEQLDVSFRLHHIEDRDDSVLDPGMIQEEVYMEELGFLCPSWIKTVTEKLKAKDMEVAFLNKLLLKLGVPR